MKWGGRSYKMMRWGLAALSLTTALSGCDLAPRYKPEPLKLPAGWGMRSF